MSQLGRLRKGAVLANLFCSLTKRLASCGECRPPICTSTMRAVLFTPRQQVTTLAPEPGAPDAKRARTRHEATYAFPLTWAAEIPSEFNCGIRQTTHPD